MPTYDQFHVKITHYQDMTNPRQTSSACDYVRLSTTKIRSCDDRRSFSEKNPSEMTDFPLFMHFLSVGQILATHPHTPILQSCN